jgi:hypothetical protein
MSLVWPNLWDPLQLFQCGQAYSIRGHHDHNKRQTLAPNGTVIPQLTEAGKYEMTSIYPIMRIAWCY